MSRCPHTDIRLCPLYVAAHDADLAHMSCIDGSEAGLPTCGVARGRDYDASVAALRIAGAGLVEHVEWQRDIERRRKQRAREMRLAGVQ